MKPFSLQVQGKSEQRLVEWMRFLSKTSPMRHLAEKESAQNLSHEVYTQANGGSIAHTHWNKRKYWRRKVLCSASLVKCWVIWYVLISCTGFYAKEIVDNSSSASLLISEVMDQSLVAELGHRRSNTPTPPSRDCLQLRFHRIFCSWGLSHCSNETLWSKDWE